MTRPELHEPRWAFRLLVIPGLLALGWLANTGTKAAPERQSAADMINTKHNLSVSGPGPIRATSETRICVFCHTPHNAAPASPLWNKEIEGQAYNVYASPTLRSGPLSQPTGPTKLCLSCHDGTIAMGAVLNPVGGIAMAGAGSLPPGSLSDFGVDLSGHHPVSFPYQAALPNPELQPTPPAELVYGGVDEVHCITCHDPHKDVYGKFLLKDNRYSSLCTTCHQLNFWTGSAHATSTESVGGILPRPPKDWPTWGQMNEWGCEVCHAPHFAPTGEQLLNFTTLPPEPFSCTSAGCHSAEPASPHVARGSAGKPATVAAPAPAAAHADIAGQIRKVSAHHESGNPILGRPAGPTTAYLAGARSVTCTDCHNPHVAYRSPAQPPNVSGMLREVTGVDQNGAQVAVASFEYEVCFKCHGDYTPDVQFVLRYIGTTNKRAEFLTTNPSYHPVEAAGRNPSVPSVPSTFEPTMTATSLIYCTDCHADDNKVSEGPHGSNYAPILRDRYETADNTPESFNNYALCYHCHDRNSILSDASFRKRARPQPGSTSGGGHSGHLAAGAPCSACHDPHGVNDSAEAPPQGSHTHLINFDRTIVQPAQGQPYPTFDDRGTFTGRCTLVCHGVKHNNSTYP